MKTKTIEIEDLVMVKVTISGWNGKAKAKKLARETEENQGARKGTVTSSINLLNDKWRHPIGTAQSRLRTAFNRYTLPWRDGGWRVVPVRKYQELLDLYAKDKREYEAAYERLLEDYHDAKAQSEADVNGLMKYVEFPTREELRDGYDVDLQQDCIVKPDDVRLEGMDEAALEELRTGMQKTFNDTVAASIQSMLEGINELLQDCVRRLGDVGEGKKVKLGSMQKVAKRTLSAMRGLNITGDDEITATIDSAEEIINGYSPEALQKGGEAARETVEDAGELMDAISNFRMGA